MGLLKFFGSVILLIASPFLLSALYIGLNVSLRYVYQVRIKKYPIIRLHPDYLIEDKRKPIWFRLFVEFPNQLLQDALANDPYDFKEFGLHLFVGEQGSGKTISMVEFLMANKRLYPMSKCITNFSYSYQDDELNDWRQLLKYNNDKYGVFKCIDEIQTWFSSKESGQMPFEMLGEISQQRKQRSCIVGTAQVFSRVVKEIREQVTFVYCPMTILGCLTIVRRTKPKYWNNEKQIFTHYDKSYFFVHSSQIRNAYDTYKKIERYKDTGFNDRSTVVVERSVI